MNKTLVTASKPQEKHRVNGIWCRWKEWNVWNEWNDLDDLEGRNPEELAESGKGFGESVTLTPVTSCYT